MRRTGFLLPKKKRKTTTTTTITKTQLEFSTSQELGIYAYMRGGGKYCEGGRGAYFVDNGIRFPFKIFRKEIENMRIYRAKIIVDAV